MLNKLFVNYYDELLDLLNYIKVGVFITDGDGVVLMVNDESCKVGGLTREETEGRNVADLEKEGFIKESITLKTLKSKKAETMIQELGDGNNVFVVSQPIYQNGEIRYVVTTEKDITEENILRKLLKERTRETAKYKQEIEYLKSVNMDIADEVVAVDPVSKMVVSQASKIAKLDVPVLLTGESGVGKEVYANLVYSNSSRVNKPFIKVNCAAIPEHLFESEMFGYEPGAFTGAEKAGKMGYFEMANTGTLFLDEIAEVPIHLQSKLLRILQENEVRRIGGTKTINVDVRVIAATNVDLHKAIEEQKFREDLFYRLNLMPIEIPPLRHRKNDIKAMAVYFVSEFNKKYNMDKFLTNGAVEMICRYTWPGNVRQLKNLIERSIISYDGLEINEFQIQRLLYPSTRSLDVDEEIAENRAQSLSEKMEAYETRLINEALKTSKNAARAAEKLGITKSTLCRRMQKYGIKNE